MSNTSWEFEDEDDYPPIDPDTLPSPEHPSDDGDSDLSLLQQSSQEIAAELAAHRLALGRLADAIKMNCSMADARNVVLHNLVMRAEVELHRLGQTLREPIELLAWTGRNLFELSLLVDYLLQSDANVRLWSSQRFQDEVELLEGVLSLHPTHTDMADVVDRLNALRATISRSFAGVPRRRPGVPDMAKVVGREAEYKAFYKLYSKYVHPTSWFINAGQTTEDDWLHRRIFIIQGRRHAVRIYDAVRRAYEFYEDEEGFYLM